MVSSMAGSEISTVTASFCFLYLIDESSESSESSFENCADREKASLWAM